MKRYGKRLLAMGLCVVLTAGLALTGCAGKKDGASKEESSSGKKGELTLWMHNGEAFVKQTKKIAGAFEKEKGIKVNIQNFPYDAMSQKMKAAYTAGNEPDMIQGFGAWMPTYINQGKLAEVPEDLSSKFAADYLKGATDGYEKDGKYYGVPIEMNVEYGLFYNPEKAAEAGVDGAPATFDDVLKIAKNSAKYNGDVQEYGGLEFHNGDNFAALFLSWIRQYGGQFWDDSKTHMNLTSDQAKQAWQRLVDLVAVDKVSDTKHITEKMPTEQYFFADKAAQLVKGSWASAVGDELKNDNWKYTFMPPVTGDTPYFVVEAGWSYVVSENSKNKENAWEFIRYCMQPENAKEFNLATGTISSLKAVVEDPSYMEDEANVRVKDQYPNLQYAESVGPVQDMDFVKKTMLDTFDKAVDGKVTTEEALKKMEKDINTHIDELLAQAK